MQLSNSYLIIPLETKFGRCSNVANIQSQPHFKAAATVDWPREHNITWPYLYKGG